MSDEVQRLARRAAGGDLGAAKRLVRELEARQGGVPRKFTQEEFEAAHEEIGRWYQGWVDDVAEHVVSEFEKSRERGIRMEGQVVAGDLARDEHPFDDSPGERATLYAIVHSPRSQDSPPSSLGRLKSHAIGCFVDDVLRRIATDEAFRTRMTATGEAMGYWIYSPSRRPT